MPEAILTAPASGIAPAAVPPAPPVVEPEITPEAIAEATRSGDLAAIKKFQTRLQTAAQTAPQTQQIPEPKPSEAKIIPDGSPDPAAIPAEKKPFVYRYKGRDVPINNEDGYMGEKNFGGMQKRLAHLKIFSEEKDQEAKTERQKRLEREEENRRLKTEHEELNKQLETMRETAKNLKPPVEPIQPAPGQKAEENELPDPPKAPSKKLDVTDEASVDEWEKFYRETGEFNSKTHSYLKNFKPQIISQTDDVTKAEVERLRKDNEEYQRERAQAAVQKKAEEQNRIINEDWNKREKFVDLHSELKPSKPLKDLHEEIVGWTDKLASALDIKKPDSNDPNQWALYEQLKSNAVYRYLHEDKEVLDKAHGFEPPADYDKYFKIADLESEHRKFIDQGQLGRISSLNDAFLFKMANDGTLDQVLETAEVNSVAKGSKAVLDTLKKNQEQFATNIPSGTQQEPPQKDLTEDEENAILTADANTLMANPELHKKKLEIMKKRGFA